MGLRKNKRTIATVLATLTMCGGVSQIALADNDKTEDNVIIKSANQIGGIYTGEYELDNINVKYTANRENNTIDQMLTNNESNEKIHMIYDIDKDILTIDGEVFEMNTAVESMDNQLYSSKEEALNDHKRILMNEFLGSVNQIEDGNIELNNRNWVVSIPSNAPYVATSLSRTLNAGTGKVGTLLQKLSTFTSALTFLPGFSDDFLLGVVSTICGLSGDIIKHYDAKMSFTWYYYQDRTKNMYQIGASTKDYAYRFRHEKINYKFTIKGKSYNSTKTHRKTGSWFASTRPW